MANRGHAEADQVLRRKVRQYVGTDIIVAERLVVPLEPQAT